MNLRKPHKPRRKGAIAVLMAFLAVPLLGMVAFAVDFGWIAYTQAQLQAASDSAVMAGAGLLSSGFATYAVSAGTAQAGVLTTSESSATTYAKNFAGYNGAGGISSLSLASSDVQYGYTTSSGSYTSPPGSGVYPNTITVTLRMDGSNNNSLGLFFAPILGMSTKNLTATSTAVIYVSGGMTGFNYNLGINGLMLPVALDVNAWNTFIATGQSPDGTVHTGSNGQPQLQVYPSPGNAPGNFGLLSIGPPATNTPSYSSWIDNGSSPSDLQYLDNNGLVPVSTSSPQPWAGGPGMKSSLQSDFASVMGQGRIIPIFQPVSESPYQAANGNGSNTTYNIVGFVGVSISEADGRGSNMNISVQSATVSDPTFNYTVVPAGEGSAGTPTMQPPKLTQ